MYIYMYIYIYTYIYIYIYIYVYIRVHNNWALQYLKNEAKAFLVL